MHPILIDLGFVTIHTYGVFIASAFLAAMAWTHIEARRKGLDPKAIPDMALAVFFGAVVGSRLLYVLIKADYYIANPLEIFMIWKGGLVFSGGAILAGLLGWHTARKLKLPAGLWLDAVAPGLALGEGIGRLGCFFAGCCYGAPCALPWAVTFTDPESLAEPLFMPLHPTQLYHSLSGFFIYAVLLLLRDRMGRPGRLMGLFLVLFATARFSVEFFRADYRGDFLGFMSVTQVTASAFLALGLLLLFWRGKGR